MLNMENATINNLYLHTFSLRWRTLCLYKELKIMYSIKNLLGILINLLPRKFQDRNGRKRLCIHRSQGIKCAPTTWKSTIYNSRNPKTPLNTWKLNESSYCASLWKNNENRRCSLLQFVQDWLLLLRSMTYW